MYGGDRAPMSGYRPLEHIKRELWDAARNYGDSSVDLSGGEPTIYAEIMDVVDFCKQLGIKPRIITHGQHLQEIGLDLFAHGLDDLLVSIHGPENVHDLVTHSIGGFERVMAGIDHLKSGPKIFRWDYEDGKPRWRFSTNTVLNKDTLEGVDALPEIFAELQPRTINFLNQSCPPYELQARHSDVAEAFAGIVGKLPQVRIKIRYMPFCVMPERLRKHIVNYPQIPYDPMEWDYASWFHVAPEKRAAITDMAKQTGIVGRNDGEVFYNTVAWMIAQGAGWHHTPKCERCSHRTICEGLDAQYLEKHGDGELKPIAGEPLPHPEFYRSGNLYTQPVAVGA